MGAVGGRRWAALGALLALALAACSRAGSAGGTGPAAGGRLHAVVASPDLYVGPPQRLLVGLFADDGRLLSFGTVRFRLSYTGTPEEPVEPVPGPEAVATFVPTPGQPARGEGPRLTEPSEARGVYQAEGVAFDRPGIWQVKVLADLAGSVERATAMFQVREGPLLPAPGDRALATENLTLASKGVPLTAVDSAAVDGRVPDPILHRWTIARALEQGRPVLVAFATPVYCTSRFCGPVVDAVEELAHRYRDRAVFVHVEIWKDFQNQVINRAAADWLLREGDLTEPWLFLIGPDGRIRDRWSPLWDVGEVSAALESLPPAG